MLLFQTVRTRPPPLSTSLSPTLPTPPASCLVLVSIWLVDAQIVLIPSRMLMEPVYSWRSRLSSPRFVQPSSQVQDASLRCSPPRRRRRLRFRGWKRNPFIILEIVQLVFCFAMPHSTTQTLDRSRTFLPALRSSHPQEERGWPRALRVLPLQRCVTAVASCGVRFAAKSTFLDRDLHGTLCAANQLVGDLLNLVLQDIPTGRLYSIRLR